MIEDFTVLTELVAGIVGDTPERIADDQAWRPLFAAACDGFADDVEAVLEADAAVASSGR